MGTDSRYAVKADNPHLCNACTHFNINQYCAGYNYYECGLVIRVTDGSPVLCEEVRTRPELCGAAGRWWEPKEQTA